MESEAKTLLLKQARDALHKALEAGMSSIPYSLVSQAQRYLAALAALEPETPIPSLPASGGCGAEPEKPAKKAKKAWIPRCKFGLECSQGLDCKFFHNEAELEAFEAARANQYEEDHDCEREMCCPCCPCPNNCDSYEDE